MDYGLAWPLFAICRQRIQKIILKFGSVHLLPILYVFINLYLKRATESYITVFKVMKRNRFDDIRNFRWNSLVE